MKQFRAVIALVFLVPLFAILVGCGTVGLPKANTPKTAGTFALVAYGLAAHVENQYLSLPMCTKPLTVVPCKTDDVEARIKAADVLAYNAAEAADAAVNDPAKQKAAADLIKTLKDSSNDANAAAAAKTSGANQ